MPSRALRVRRLIAVRSMRAWLRQTMSSVTLDPMSAMIGVALRMPTNRLRSGIAMSASPKPKVERASVATKSTPTATTMTLIGSIGARL
jgi:hypothetical protein